eukprot:SAG11_NODE_117_length_15962_cov_71.527925_2_plen_85_part_00
MTAHLAEQIRKTHGLDVKTVHAVELLPIEVLHLVGGNHAVIVGVDAAKPELERDIVRLVLFAQREPHEIVVPHAVRRAANGNAH